MSRIALALLLVFSCLTSHADTQPLRVGITEVPPFVIKNEDGGWSGISVDLWNAIAEKNGYAFHYEPMPFNSLLDSLEQSKVDVVVGALTMTPEREARFDFTHPFYFTGLAIAVPATASAGWWTTFTRLFSWRFISVVLGLAAVLMLVGAVIWLFERQRNREQFPEDPVRGLGDGFWWAAVTMTTVGYGDKSPVTLGGRLVAVVWMFAALIMVSTFTAAMTTALTVSNLQGAIQGPGDLQGAHVASVQRTASSRWLQEQRIRQSDYPNLTQALQSVQQGEADAIVYDKPILQYRNRELVGARLQVLPGTFENQSYGFLVRSGSALREPISRAILGIMDDPQWARTVSGYLGEEP
ncbi:transporter substrate-binding domain-containing protein [Pseudomonas sp. SH1-B]